MVKFKYSDLFNGNFIISDSDVLDGYDRETGACNQFCVNPILFIKLFKMIFTSNFRIELVNFLKS